MADERSVGWDKLARRICHLRNLNRERRPTDANGGPALAATIIAIGELLSASLSHPTQEQIDG
jgi:hypothetical protein